MVAQSHESFLAGLALYERRPDKQYSLVDCISMNVMRQKQVQEILTHDRHFSQEGFTRLLGCDKLSFRKRWLRAATAGAGFYVSNGASKRDGSVGAVINYRFRACSSVG